MKIILRTYLRYDLGILLKRVNSFKNEKENLKNFTVLPEQRKVSYR